MAAIMKCQIIPLNIIITWQIRSVEISATPNKTKKQIDTYIKSVFYGIPGSVIHQTKKRLNYQTKNIYFTVTKAIIEAWIHIGII